MDKKTVKGLIRSKESFRIERTISTNDKEKFCQAICAFSNDLPRSGKPGYLLIGVTDEGALNGLKVTDKLLTYFAGLRTDGNILPIPTMAVDYVSFDDGDVIVVKVLPSAEPPVRYNGRCHIRIGPRKDIATRTEEDILSERRLSSIKTFDMCIMRIPEVTECYNTSGAYDYLLKVRARDMKQYQEFVLTKLGDIDTVGSIESTFVMSEVKQNYGINI